MQKVIRATVLVLMAMASGPAFADGDANADEGSDQLVAHHEEKISSDTKASEPGSGSGESSAAPRAGVQETSDAQTMYEFNHQQFLDDTWTKP